MQTMTPFLIDTHCHLDMEHFSEDQDAVITRALENGVRYMVTIGTGGGLSGARNAIALAEKHDCIYASVGVHPHDADSETDMQELAHLAHHPKVVAIGETGLDFYRDWSPVEKQREIFSAQIKIAQSVNKPLIIHSRDAGQECLDILQQHNASTVGGVFHCFSENAEFAANLVKVGFYVSFPGQITFKKAQLVRDTCKAIPLEQILVETDSPFLAPEPHRGKRCEPAFVVHTAKRLAEEKEISLDELAKITTHNARTLFKAIPAT